MNKRTTKIKLVAIAKDEAAYLHEWIHHHLYLAFDEIEIYLNRTSDNSEIVLSNIQKTHSNVRWHSADWVDTCPPDVRKNIQFIAYAHALHETKKDPSFTHVLFLDIDELLILDGLKKNIHEFLEEFPQNSAVLFEWLNDIPEQQEAYQNLAENLYGKLSPLGKTLFPTSANFKELRHHISLLNDNTPIILVDKSSFVGQQKIKQALIPSLNSLKNSFIYHRANRSPKEYISLLFRGRPGDSFSYKSNRHGYPVKNKNTIVTKLDSSAYEHYIESFEKFKIETKFNQTNPESTKFIEKRYQLSIDNIDKHLKIDYKLMVKLFSGLNDKNVMRTFKNFRKNILSNNENSIENLIELSFDAEKISKKEAIEILKIAKKKRPNGKIINNRLDKLTKL